MATKLYLKNGIKFRKEKNYILICDCINFLDFQLPLECYDILYKLQNGLNTSESISKFALDVLSDLQIMDLLCDNPNDKVKNTNKTLNTCYSENEFFK